MTDSIVRSYTRSKVPRRHWTKTLHRLFVEAVEYLGGERSATPKKIVNYMGVRDLTIPQVKSHLQMYRNGKEEDAIKERRMIKKMNRRQSQQYLQIYERVRDATQFIKNQQRLQLDITKKVSCNSLYQSSKMGQNENRNKDFMVAGDGANGEEELSLELTLGCKY